MIHQFIRCQTRGLLPLSVIFLAGLLGACSKIGSLADGAKVQHPHVEFVGARLADLSFERVNLLFDLSIQNPNALGLQLAGFSYDLAINDNPFLQGKEDRGLTIEAHGESTIQIPLMLRFEDLYRAFNDLRRKDESTYRLKCDLLFDLPILGIVKVPASRSGSFPLPKIPAVTIEELELKRLGPLGADLVLGIRLDNPNAFSMILEGMQYQLEIDGRPWAAGETGQQLAVREGAEGLVEIPISLDFLQIGRSVQELLSGDAPLSYRLRGDLDLNSAIPLLGRTRLPIDQSGQIRLRK